jgi:hypothetical protein
MTGGSRRWAWVCPPLTLGGVWAQMMTGDDSIVTLTTLDLTLNGSDIDP